MQLETTVTVVRGGEVLRSRGWELGGQSSRLSVSSQGQVLQIGEVLLDSITHPKAKRPESRLTNSNSHFRSSDLSSVSFVGNPSTKAVMAIKLLEVEH